MLSGYRCAPVRAYFCFAVLVLAAVSASAQPASSTSSALTWLNSQQRPNGTWGNLPEFAPRDTARVVIAQTLVGSTAPSVQGALAWLGSQSAFDPNQFLAEQALALATGKLDPNLVLTRLTQQRSSNAPDYGGFAEYNGNSYDSALAIQALVTNEQTWTTSITGALTILLTRQNADGGWGLDQGFDSNPIVTAEVLIALSSLKMQMPPEIVISAAQGYLSRLMKADGSIGNGVLETAVCYRALALSGYSLSATSASTMQFLSAAQRADGSWSGDPYLTARVLDAYASNKANLTIRPAEFTLTPASAADGTTVKATIIVRNIGAEGSVLSNLSLYSSEEKTRTLGTASITTLPPGGSQTVVLNFVATNLTGRNTLLAVVDINNTVKEMREDDNTATADLVVDGKPDLQVFSTDVVTSPSKLQPDQPATLGVTFRNHGDGDAINVGYAIYDKLDSLAETLLKKDTISSLEAGTSSLVSLPISFAGGTHTVRVVVDPDLQIVETSETNNTALRSISVVTVSSVDLVVVPGSVTATPSRPAAGQVVTVTAMVQNTGTDPLRSNLAFYDGLPGAGGIVFAVHPLTIDSQSSQFVQANYTATATSRVIYAVADPDNVLAEIDENNNRGFAALTDQYADLALTRESFALPKTQTAFNQSVTGRLVVWNHGTLDATGVRVIVYDDLPQNGGKVVSDTTVNVPAQGKTVVSASWVGRSGQRLATAVVNPSQSVFEIDYSNNRITRPYNVAGNEGDVNLWNVRSTSIDVTGLTVNATELTATGVVRVELSFAAGKSFNVILFEDVDGDSAFNPEVDGTLGSTFVQSGFSPSTVILAIDGGVRFAPGKLFFYFDSTNAMNEVNESNNFLDLWQNCETTVDTVAPVVKWSNTSPATHFSPVARVIDTNGDDVVDINDVPHVVQVSGGTIRLLRGSDGQPVWSQTFGTTGRQIAPVIADLDGDGRPEILVHEDQHRIVALNGNGTRKWTSPELERNPKWDAYLGTAEYSYVGAPLVADLDGDGKTEVVVGRTCLNGLTGTIKWVGTGGSGRAWYTADERLYHESFPDQEAPVAADITGDGRLEVIAGNTAYRPDGTVLWQRSDLSDGYTAPVVLAQISVVPRIALVGEGKIWLLNPDGTTRWGPVAIPGGTMLGGAPTMFTDSGGGPWIGVAGDGNYTVFNANTGAIRWTKPTTTDLSFGITTTNSATAFDFTSSMSLVYAARDKLIIFRSTDGATLYSLPIVTAPFHPMLPAIADVTDDGRADIVVPGTAGLKLIGDPTWNFAPAIFNEAAYHVVNVSNEMAAIPRNETTSGFSRTHYRASQAVQLAGTPIPNLTASYMRADTNAYPASAKLIARIGNNGWQVSPPAKVAFFRLNTNNTSTFLGTADASSLAPGRFEDVAFTINSPAAGLATFYAIADSTGTTGSIAECNENDNRAPNVTVRFSADVVVDAALLLVSDPGPRPGETITFTAIADLSGAMDSSLLAARFFLGPPSDGAPISGILPVQVSSMRNRRQAQVDLQWTVTAPTGPHSVYVVFDVNNAITEDDENNNTGVYQLDVSTSEPILKLSGTMRLTPPSAETAKPIGIDALIQNIGNVPLQNVVLNYNVTGGAGTGFSGTATIASLAKYDFAAVSFGAFTPTAEGTYTVTITPADPSITVIVESKSLKIAPFAGALMTALPARIPISLPLAQCHTNISRRNTIVAPDDPIVPLIKAHIQTGLNWQAPVLNTAMADNCYKCHVQSQGMVAFETSLQVSGVTLNTAVQQKLYDQTVGTQQPNGHFGTNGSPKTTSILGAWQLSYWHDPQQAKPYLVKALNLALGYQNADGSFACDFCGISFGNREAMTMMAMIAFSKGHDLTRDPRYLTVVAKAVNWAMAYNYTATRTSGPEFAARVSIGLSSALPQIADPTLAQSMENRIGAISTFLRSVQNVDGSFGQQITPDFPVIRTAQSLYALALAGVPGTDPALRAAILWLINKQQSNGGWKEHFNEPNQVEWLDESTWAMIALPAAFARLGQFDVDLQLFLPAATDLISSNIPPGSIRAVSGGRELGWRFPAVTDDGYDLLLNLKLNGIRAEEQRPLTGTATLSYNEPYTGAPVTRTVAVPLVTGFAPLSLEVSTDKPNYAASTPVVITEKITNVGTTTTAITHDLIIRDGNGATVATVATNDPIAGLPARAFPGWRYGMPVSAAIDVAGTSRQLAFTLDFAQKLSELGVTGTFDLNSIRVSSDAAASEELYYSFLPTDSSGLRGTLAFRLPDAVTSGSTFSAHVYFDIVENGFKPRSMFDVRSGIGFGNGVSARYWTLDTTRSFPHSTTPSLIPVGEPVLNFTQPTTIISSPAPHPVQYWMTEWNAAFFVPTTGTYQLLIGSDDGSWLYIDDQLVVQNPGLHGLSERTASKALTAGFHKLKFLMFNWGGGYGGYVKWAPPGKSFGLIPTANLFPSLPASSNITVGAAQIFPDGTTTRTYTWNTGATAAGPYSAVGLLKQFGTFVNTDDAPFSITPAAEVTGTVATDKPAYDVGETVRVNAAVRYDVGNTPVSNLTATVSVLDPAGAALSSTTTPIASIVVGQSIPVRLDWPAGSSPAGTYGARLVVQDAAGATTVDKRVPFELRPTSQSGKGITGTLSTPASVYQGEVLPVSVTLTNSGNSALTAAPFEIRLIDPLTETLVATVPFAATVNAGGTFSTQLTHPTIQLKIQNYQAWLVSMITGSAVPLANTTFEVRVPPLKLAMSVGGPARVLIWADCANGNSTSSCTPIEPAFLTTTLTSAGIPWSLVGNQYDFIVRMRTGAYSAAVIYQAGPFETKIADEYVEQIRSGFGLVYIKNETNADPKLLPALGVSFRGKVDTVTTLLDVLATPFSSAGTLTLNGPSVTIELQGAAVAARVAATQEPAITHRTFGSGRVVTIPFNTEMTATTEVASLLVAGVKYVSRVPSTDARQVVPIDLKVTPPPGAPSDLTIGVQLPPGFTVVFAQPALSSTSGHPSWNVTAAGEEFHLYLWIRLPEAIGSYSVTGTAAFAGQLPAVTTALTLTVTADRVAMENAVDVDLTSLATAAPSGDQQAITKARDDLNAIRAAAPADQASVIAVIEKILQLVDSLKTVSIDTTAARLNADRMLIYWQSRVGL